jgi:pilus assembly protein CpaB
VRRTNFVILVLAIVMGGIAALLVTNWLRNRTAVAAAPSATIVVATANLPFGTPITEDKITELQWAASSLPEGAFRTKLDLLRDGRRVTLASIGANEPILNNKITGPNQRASLSSMVESGKRAVTVRVDDVRGVAGFILPNDHVDVVLIRTEGGQRFSDLLLQNVKVLAIDQVATEQRNQPTVARAVTLEVTPQQAQKITLATDIGRLSLVLRQAGESALVSDGRISESDLIGQGRRGPVETTAGPAPAPSNTTTVVIIRGLKETSYPVFRYGQ